MATPWSSTMRKIIRAADCGKRKSILAKTGESVTTL
jgi:hypothetical protein